MPQIAKKNESSLKQQIAASRARLQRLWNIYGQTNPVVLAASIELDELINSYHRQNKTQDLNHDSSD